MRATKPRVLARADSIKASASSVAEDEGDRDSSGASPRSRTEKSSSKPLSSIRPPCDCMYSRIRFFSGESALYDTANAMPENIPRPAGSGEANSGRANDRTEAIVEVCIDVTVPLLDLEAGVARVVI